jgi:hypothetical protein
VLRGLLALADLGLGRRRTTATWLRFVSDYLPDRPTASTLADYPWLLLGILPIWHILLRGAAARVRFTLVRIRRLVEVGLLTHALPRLAHVLRRLAWVSRLGRGVRARLLVFLVGSRPPCAPRCAGATQRTLRSDVLIASTARWPARSARDHRHPELGFRCAASWGRLRRSGRGSPWPTTRPAVVVREEIGKCARARPQLTHLPLKLRGSRHHRDRALRADLLGIDPFRRNGGLTTCR